MRARSRSRALPVWIALAALPVLFACVYLLQVSIDARRSLLGRQEEELVLTSSKMLRRMSLGYDSLLADIYWTRAVQYYGRHLDARDGDFHLLPALLDLATDLDPHLQIAYHFGSIFDSEPGRGGAARTDLAIKLIEKGIAAEPDNWKLQYDRAFIYYWYLKDYPHSAAAYLEARRRGGPESLAFLAARIAEKGGSFEMSWTIWMQVYESAKDDNTRRFAREHLETLRAEEDASQLQKLVDEYHRRFGRFPASTREMAAAGLLQGIPLDPEGRPYRLTPDGKVRLDPDSPVQSETLKPSQPPSYR